MNPIIQAIFLVLFLAALAGCQQNLPAPRDYDVVCYAATYSKGIYKSDNGGTSWFPLEVDQTPLYARYKILYKSPYRDGLLYITTTGAGLFTLDLETSVLDSVDQFKTENVHSVAFYQDPRGQRENKEVLIGINRGGVFKASDGDGSWKPCNQGLTYRDVMVLFVRGTDLFAGTVKDLFRWDEGLKHWTPASNGIRNKNILSIAASPDGKTLYAGSGSYGEKKGLFKKIPCLYTSTDQGRTWTACDQGIPDETLVYDIVPNPGRPGRIYLGTSDGIYRSINAGQDWSKMEKGLPKRLKVFDIKMGRMSDGKDVVYAAGSNGVFMSTDDDETLWVNKSYGLERTAITGIILLPK